METLRSESVLLAIAKSLRSFIFTALAVSIPFFLGSLNISTLQTSLIILVSLGISTAYLYIFTSINMKSKQKLVLLSTLFFAALAFVYFEQNLFALIAAIFVGSISLAGRDLTANQSIEQYTISTYSENQKEKNLMFAIYNFGSYGASAVSAGFLFLFGENSYSLIFLVLMVLALIQVIIYASMKFPDLEKKKQKKALSDRTVRRNISNLATLFSVDAIGGGLVNTAIISLWFKVVYNITLSQAGLIFVVVNIITALSVIGSNFISNRMGLVKTMVYTHLISNVFLFMIPVFHSLIISEFFLYLRQSTSQMDVPARDSFVNTFIPKDARVAGNSTFLAVRNGGQVPGPGLAGIILEIFPPGVFFAASLTKIAYDLAFFTGYKKHNI